MPRYIVTKTRDLDADHEVGALHGVSRQVPLTRNLMITDLIEADEDAYDDICDCPHIISVVTDDPVELPQPIAASASAFHQTNFGIGLHYAESAWKHGFKGKLARVAVLDTGIDETHASSTFRGRLKGKRNFTSDHDAYDYNGHGTHVAGIVGGPDQIGIAPECEIISGKVLNNRGTGRTSWIMAGIEWAVKKNADIINLSLGGLPCQENSPIKLLIERVRHRGILPVVAAGNSGCEYGNEADQVSPGCSGDAITVAALDRNLQHAHFSSCGQAVDIAAFGQDVYSLWINGSVNIISGTSMACPQVAGGLALMLTAWKRPEDVRRVLYGSADELDVPINRVGIGSLNIDAAIDRLRKDMRDGY